MGSIYADEMILAPTAVTNKATTTASSTVVDLWADGAGDGYWDFSVKGADVHILFSPLSTMADVTVASGFYMAAGVTKPWYINAARRYCKIIATTTVTGSVVSIARAS